MSRSPEVEDATSPLAAKDTFRILIMDTVKHVKMLKQACKAAGHAVVPARSIEAAFAFLETENHADVIIYAAASCVLHDQTEAISKVLTPEDCNGNLAKLRWNSSKSTMRS